MEIQIGSFLIPYYGLCIVIGVLVAGIVGCVQVKKYELDINDFFILSGMVALGGMIGAKILYLLVSGDKIEWTKIIDLNYLNSIMAGGFVFYGGLIGGLLMLLLCEKWFRISIKKYVEYCMPCIPVVHGFGRLGCFFAGCCYGVPYSGIGAVTYHHSLIAPNHISLFPVQAVEAVINLVIAATILLYICQKKSGQRHSLSLYLLLYAPVRFVLEFFRYDHDARGFWGVCSTSQWISIALIIAVVGNKIFCLRKRGIYGTKEAD